MHDLADTILAQPRAKLIADAVNWRLEAEWQNACTPIAAIFDTTEQLNTLRQLLSQP